MNDERQSKKFKVSSVALRKSLSKASNGKVTQRQTQPDASALQDYLRWLDDFEAKSRI